jgi:hypothetical protein
VIESHLPENLARSRRMGSITEEPVEIKDWR